MMADLLTADLLTADLLEIAMERIWNSGLVLVIELQELLWDGR
jgi:hypothetical protein